MGSTASRQTVVPVTRSPAHPSNEPVHTEDVKDVTTLRVDPVNAKDVTTIRVDPVRAEDVRRLCDVSADGKRAAEAILKRRA